MDLGCSIAPKGLCSLDIWRSIEQADDAVGQLQALQAFKSAREKLAMRRVTAGKFLPQRGQRAQPRVSTLGFIDNSEKRRIPGKHRLLVRTIQAGSLCYIAFRSVERSLEDILTLSPRTHGNHATA